MVAGCTLEMASSSAKNPMIPLVSDQPGKECGVKPLEELTLAIPGEK